MQTIEKAKGGDANARKFIMEQDNKQDTPDPFEIDDRDAADLDVLLGSMAMPDAGNPFDEISDPNDGDKGGRVGKNAGASKSGSGKKGGQDNG